MLVRLPQSRERRQESRLAGHVLDQADHHAHAGTGEPDVPIDLLPQRSHDERRDKRPDVDPDVEDREPRITSRVIVVVEGANHRTRVRLQQPGADDDQAQTEIERRDCGDRHAEVAERDDDPAKQDTAVLAEHLVG